jgi:AcrR family transcriptional regulator
MPRKPVALDATSAGHEDPHPRRGRELFVEHGFEATSLRSLTSAAGVNLAAVNYHFGSKEELFQAVLTRRLDPMNQERIELLGRIEREAAGRALSCEKILFAMLIPASSSRATRSAAATTSCASWAARTRIPRPSSAFPLGPVRRDDRPLQGGVPRRRCRTCRARSSRGGCIS